jgi:uncharacterized membrane protein YcfT
LTRYSAPGCDAGRADWVDVGKALCIILVVMMHATLGLQGAIGRTGFMDAVVAFCAPFRIPAFFVLSGLFLARALKRDFSSFVRGRIAHFAYFYLLWVAIQTTSKSGGLILSEPAFLLKAMLWSIAEPYGTLWFIHLLAVFSLVTWLLRGRNPLMLLVGAAILELLPIATGSTLIDEFAARYVYFTGGWALAPLVFGAARRAADHAGATTLLIIAFGVLNGAVVFSGFGSVPVVSLALGAAGALALAAAAALLSRAPLLGPGLRFIGSRTLTIYVAFFIPMAAARFVLVHLGVGDLGPLAIGFASIAITVAAVAVPLLMESAVRGTPARVLFERPQRSAPDAVADRLRQRMEATLQRPRSSPEISPA